MNTTAPLQDLINMIEGLELPTSSFGNVTTLRARLLADLVALGLGVGGGTVTSITASGLLTATPNPIITSGTIQGASIADLRILGNISGGAAEPSAQTLTAVFDAILGSTQGQILYRNAANWTVLNPGTANNILVTGGAAANPSYTTLSAVIDALISSTQGTILYRSGAGWVALAVGTAGQVLTTQGAAANPTWETPSAGGSFSGARVFRTTNQAIGAATLTPVSFDSEIYDVGGYFAGGTPTLFTVPDTAKYHVNCSAQLSVAGDVALEINGTTNIAVSTTGVAGSDLRCCVATDINLTAADTVRLMIFIVAGGNVVTGSQSSPVMSIHKLG